MTYVGPFPPEQAIYVSFAAAVSPATSLRKAADSFVATLRAPSAAPTYKTKGMELPR